MKNSASRKSYSGKGVAVGAGVAVGDGKGVGGGVEVGRGVSVGVAVWVGVDVWVGLDVSVGVAVLVGVMVGVAVAAPVGVGVKVGSGLNSRVGLGLASLRVLMKLLTRPVTPSSGVGVDCREAESLESGPEKTLKSRSRVGDAVGREGGDRVRRIRSDGLSAGQVRGWR